MIVKRILLLLVILILGYRSASACSCGGYPSPCEAYNGVDAVFIGLVTKIDPEKPVEEIVYSEQFAYVQIERSFKGIRESSDIVLHQPAHNCAPKFRSGGRYLFYASFHKDSKTREVFGCGRGSSLNGAYDDLLYLQGLPDSAKRTSRGERKYRGQA